MDKTVTVRLWEPTEDGDASAEGVLQVYEDAEVNGDGPLYSGYVIDRQGNKTWVTIN